MNAEDRALAVLSRANPMPDNLPIESSTDAHAYLATLQTRSSEVTQLETKPKTDQPRPSSTWIAIAAVVAVVLGVAVVILTTTNEEPPVADDPLVTTTVATTEPEASMDPQLEEALAVATGFMEASASGDTEALKSLVLMDGHTSSLLGLIGIERTELESAWRDALGWTIVVEECVVTNPDVTNTSITCHTTHRNAISDALGVGPYSGRQHLKLLYEGDVKGSVIIEDTIVSQGLEVQFATTAFATEAADPFLAWLEATHPEDVALMIEPEANDFDVIRFGRRAPVLSQESIELWRQHVAEFVAEQSG